MRHKRIISKDKTVVVLLDTTYWGKRFGMVIIKDANRNKVLWYKFITHHERVDDYMEGIEWLKEYGFHIKGAVCDGLKGLFQKLSPIPTQMCQFHMILIVKKYLTNKPDIQASIDLLNLAMSLTSKTQEEFITDLANWYKQYATIVDEKHIDNQGKNRFVRPRLRSAYLSLKRHSPWLWTYQKYPERDIPNTNASIESTNSRLKTILRVHSGITAERRQKLLENYIAKHY